MWSPVHTGHQALRRLFYVPHFNQILELSSATWLTDLSCLSPWVILTNSYIPCGLNHRNSSSSTSKSLKSEMEDWMGLVVLVDILSVLWLCTCHLILPLSSLRFSMCPDFPFVEGHGHMSKLFL